MPTLAYTFMYGDSFSGSFSDGEVEDIVLQLYGDSFSGSFSEAIFTDNGLILNGDAFSGSMGDGIFAIDPSSPLYELFMYGDAFFGSIAEGRLLLDRDEAYFRRYWTESDWQIGGSAIGESQTGTSVESEGSV